MTKGSRGLRQGGCAICKHPDRARIEALRASGASLVAVAKRFGLTGKDAVFYHFKHHVSAERRASLMIGPAKFEQLANQAAEESRSLLERMNIATSILFSRFLACAEAGDDHALANIGGRLNAMFRDYARLTGELREASSITINNSVNIITTPEFTTLQTGLIALARRYPAARSDIIGLLRSLDVKQDAPTQMRSNGGAQPIMIEGEALHA